MIITLCVLAYVLIGAIGAACAYFEFDFDVKFAIGVLLLWPLLITIGITYMLWESFLEEL